MGQGLTGAPGTYARMKDNFSGTTSAPYGEAALRDVRPGIGFECFADDDIGAAKGIEEMLDFLHNHYFPRLAWAGLTLDPKKTILTNPGP